MHSRTSLANDLRAMGLRGGDVVMVHSSLRAIGEVAGGPDQVHLAIKDVLTDEGTLVMYASCPRYVDEVGRGNLTAQEEAEVLAKLPAFDALTARSARDNGALVECFRTWPGSRVNNHPARFVAWGRHSDTLFLTQPWDMAFGKDSPLDRFTHLNGRILLLGCDHDAVTYLHYAEHIGDFPGKRIARFKVPVLENGERIWRDMTEVDTSSDGAHENWPEQFFAHIVDGYLAANGNGGGQVGSAHCHLFQASGLLEYALPVMVRAATGKS